MNKDLKDQAREGALLLALGINYEYLGRTDLAREFLYKALAIHRERQNLYMQGYTLRTSDYHIFRRNSSKGRGSILSAGDKDPA